MTTQHLRQALLTQNSSPRPRLPSGTPVPAHFHLTEFGVATKDFVDCGGTFRQERKATLQLWTSIDTDHRLSTARLLEILDMGSKHFDADGLEVQVEFQGERTVEVFGLEADAEGNLQLTGTETACLAGVACGVPLAAPPSAEPAFGNLAGTTSTACAPGSGCC